jgi:single-stranded-DNA-specific exonuclease
MRLWRCNPLPIDGRDGLAQELGISPTTAGLLLARGCVDAASAHRFLHPSLDDLHDPFLLPDMDAAVTRIAHALETKEKILVHGDYDVDGVSSAALLTRVLRALGANVEPFVPHRREDGYDLRVTTVLKKKQEGFGLIITVDCGIVAHEAAECAIEQGIDLIITDHHQLGASLPRALAVINPHRPDSPYPFKSLAGVGVTFKLATALVRRLGVPERSFRTKFLDLVALGTTVDCMPLVDENRIFVKFGLEAMRTTGKPGLRALMAVAGVEPRRLDTRSLGFYLGPRINAVGRLDAAEYALKLLLTGDENEAVQLAQRLDRCNLERQEAQNRIFQEAQTQALGPARKDDRVLVLAAPDWHSGVIGIVASKIVEKFGRPAIMIALEGERGRGSARSIEGFHISDALGSCRELLERCGGHALAAGFDIRAERVDEFRQMLGVLAAEQLTDEALQPRINVDAHLDPGEVSLRLARELQRLEPFGHGNAEPIFMTQSVPLVAADVWQPKTGNVPHLSLRCRLAAGSPVHAIFWRNGEKADELRGVQQIDLCYQLEVDEYRGMPDLRLIVKDLRLPADEIQ